MRPRTRELPSDRPTDALEQLRGELERVLQDTLRHNPFPRIGPSDEIDFYTEVERYEKALILAALSITKCRQNRAAELLHLSPSTLSTKIKALGIDTNEI